MTETVEFRLEQSLPELQDLVHKELFTQDEVRTIIKKRTQNEHTLLRKTAKISDFLRYIQYEMNLESLRKKRHKRLKSTASMILRVNVEPGGKSLSDYAGPRRIRNIFQRATTRFQDIGLWLQYIEYSKSQDSAKLTGKLFGEALQKFPSSSELWILAAKYEYDTNYNISGARNLLLRSLRLNPEKRDLWLEYAKLECLYILKIMERRRVLGLDKQEDKMVDDKSGFDDQNEITLPTITQEELQKTDGPQLDPLLTSPLTNVSTNPALNGAIPLAVYSSAITSRPDDISLVAGFYDIFESFYSGLSFIDSALDTVKGRLLENFPGRGKTFLIQIKDHARGIGVTDKRFPTAIREMMKTANGVPKLPLKERMDCCAGLSEYLEKISMTDGLDENLQKVIEIFRGRVGKWKDIMD